MLLVICKYVLIVPNQTYCNVYKDQSLVFQLMRRYHEYIQLIVFRIRSKFTNVQDLDTCIVFFQLKSSQDRQTCETICNIRNAVEVNMYLSSL